MLIFTQRVSNPSRILRQQNRDAVHFVTPEHNLSVPAALKNALDVGSSPCGSSVRDRKPGAVITCYGLCRGQSQNSRAISTTFSYTPSSLTALR
jgi:NAD(P)H-dependent FMN reductase